MFTLPDAGTDKNGLYRIETNQPGIPSGSVLICQNLCLSRSLYLSRCRAEVINQIRSLCLIQTRFLGSDTTCIVICIVLPLS